MQALLAFRQMPRRFEKCTIPDSFRLASRPVFLVSRTSESLLDRLRSSRPDSSEWRRLQEIYLPLIRSWLLRFPGIGEEIDDLCQEILLIVVKELPQFQRQRDGAFRAWLRQVTTNRLRTYWRRRQKQPVAGGGQQTEDLLAQLEDPHSALSKQWDRDHDRHVLQRLLATVKPDFDAVTWDAFTRFALEGKPAAAVADDLGLSQNAVVLAKYRVLKRLREEGVGLVG
jgi:RNA polymerase sigma-70 factor (ECF subfamily)